MEKITDPATATGNPPYGPARARRATPAAAISRLPPSAVRGLRRFAAGGPSAEPSNHPSDDGTVHRPAASGVSPSPSWRYWVRKNEVPYSTKKPAAFVASGTAKILRRRVAGSTHGAGRDR